MPQFLETILSNPLYIAIAVVLVLFLLYSVVKRVIKLILFIIILLLAFLAYVHFTGGDVKDSLEKVKEKGEKLVK
jgi:glucan phosphoethanolaminetransferase (alkaline phosphatase superfamily)